MFHFPEKCTFSFIASVAVIAIVMVLAAAYILFDGYYLLNQKYFVQIPQQEAGKFLEIGKVDSCIEFRRAYLSGDNKSNYFLAAAAYNFGVCVPQDLGKAAELYEQDIAHGGGSIASLVKLSMIYAYGPGAYRNKNRADFLYKQIAINLAGLSKNLTRSEIDTLLLGYYHTGHVPYRLKRDVDWAFDLLEQPLHHRKYVHQQLSEEGFDATFFLVDPLESKKAEPQE